MAKHARTSSNDDILDDESAEAFARRLEQGSAHTTGRHASGFSYQGDEDGDYPDAFESLEPLDQPSLIFDEEPLPVDAGGGQPAGRHGKQDGEAAGTPPVPAHVRRSRRVRRILIAVIVVVILAFVALGVLTYAWIQESNTVAAQLGGSNGMSEQAADTSGSGEKETEVVELVSLLGMTSDEALEAVGRGAEVTRTTSTADAEEDSDEDAQDDDEDADAEAEVDDDVVVTNVTLTLADEPQDDNGTSPSVYLGLNAAGMAVQVGYSASISLLGYGQVSFADAVESNELVEQALSEAGVDVDSGTAVLPEDRAEYTTYASDGDTVLKESYTFTGSAEVDGSSVDWSVQLLYDYSASNASGDLDDTVRYVYVYVSYQ